MYSVHSVVCFQPFGCGLTAPSVLWLKIRVHINDLVAAMSAPGDLWFLELGCCLGRFGNSVLNLIKNEHPILASRHF